MSRTPLDDDGRKVLAKALKKVPDEILTCYDRAVGHNWSSGRGMRSPILLTGERLLGRQSLRIAKRSSACLRCATFRVEEFAVSTRSGVIEKLSNTYTYPDAYSLPGVPRGVKPSVIVWQEQYRRAIEASVQEQARRDGRSLRSA